jgi:hypothetical protein
MKIDWDKQFSAAERSLMIQNRNPAPDQGGRNLFKEDRALIDAAAEKHGFYLQKFTVDNPRAVSYIRRR